MWSLIVLGLGVFIAIISLTGIDFHIGPFEPLSVGCFFTTFGGAGWIANKIVGSGSVAFFIAVIVSVFATCFVQLAVIPLRRTEATTASEMTDVVGLAAKVILAIPKDGTGEILISTPYGRLNRMAASFEKIEIPSDQEVIIIEIKESVCYVSKKETLEEELNKL